MAGELALNQFRWTTTQNQDFVIGDPSDGSHNTRYLVFQTNNTPGYANNPHLACAYNSGTSSWAISISIDGVANIELSDVAHQTSANNIFSVANTFNGLSTFNTSIVPTFAVPQVSIAAAGPYTPSVPNAPNTVTFVDPHAGTDDKIWQFFSPVTTGTFGLYAINDAYTGANAAITLTRTGTTISNVTVNSILTATSFTGAGTGLTGMASGLSIGGNAATATTSNNISATNNTTNANYFPVFATTQGTSVALGTDSGFTFNPSTGVLTATSFTGAGTGLTGMASGLSIGGNALTSTNLQGGIAGSIPYQSATNTTAMLSPAANGTILTMVAGIPAWSSSPIHFTQDFIATAGQTAFILGSGNTYTIGTGSIEVFQNGVRLISGVDYTETNSTTVTLTVGANAGDYVSIITGNVVNDTTGLAAVAQLTANLGDTVNVANGDAFIGVRSTFTGAVARTQHQKNAEWISVDDFGADPTGVVDSTAAFQAALNTGKNVYAPGNVYLISGSLILTNQKLEGRGSVNDSGAFAQTKLNIPTGNFPCFINSSTEFTNFEVTGFWIQYGAPSAVAPTSSTTNGLQYGFYFTGATYWPQLAKISNCTVRNGWGFFYSTTGTYLTLLERCFSYTNTTGFTQVNGTTLTCINCYHSGGVQGFYLNSVPSANLITCGTDNMTITSTSTLSSGNSFVGCRGLTIQGWEHEANSVATGCSFMRFDGCNATINGMTGVANKFTGLSTGQESYWIWAEGGSYLNLINVRPMQNVNDLTCYNSTGGAVYTVESTGSAVVTALGCWLAAPTNDSTSSALLYSMSAVGAEITYSNCYTSGFVNNASQLLVQSTSASMTGLTGTNITGTTALTGTWIQTGKVVEFWINIAPSGNITTTLGSSYISGLPFTPSINSTGSVVDTITASSLGVTLVTSTGKVYLPAITASSDTVEIHGTCLVN